MLRPMQNRIEPFPVPPRVPAGTTIIAFGDVHGHLDLVEEIFAQASARARAKPDRKHIVISLGDLVDRGPDSRGVVQRLMGEVPGCELHVLRGNHETLLMAFLRGDRDADVWVKWGGLQTIGSYGVDIKGVDPSSPKDIERLREDFRAKMIRSHYEFMRTRPLSLTYGDYFFVHAGVRPDVPLAEQKEYDLIWIRDEFLPSGQLFEKKIVHGHTPVDAADFRGNRINLDTGACYGGTLTAAIFEDDDARVFASLPSRIPGWKPYGTV
jgi:serine/threonine protein phosphatase 1